MRAPWGRKTKRADPRRPCRISDCQPPAADLEQEPRAKLDLARVADPRNESCRLPEIYTTRVAGIVRAEVGRVEGVEQLDKDPELLVASERYELRRAQVHDRCLVAAGGIDRDLLAGRRVDPPIVVRAVRIEIAASRQVVRARAGQLQDGRELDSKRKLEHARGHHPVTLVGPIGSPFTLVEDIALILRQPRARP